MQVQNFKNHSTLKSPSKLFILFWLALFFALIMACVILFNSNRTDQSFVVAILLFVLAVIQVLNYFLYRTFSLKAQDRAIRAEENLRHFVLSGKLHSSKLRISQIIALRFASDEEFIALSEKAAVENLSNLQIKKLIQNWKADYHRA